MRLGLRSPEQRLWLPLITALAVANINGVVILAIFLVFLLPLPAVEDRDAALQTNLIALAGLLAAASPIALIWVRALWWPILRWLRSGSPPRDKDRRRVLRAPARVLLVPTAFWASGVVLFTLLNTAYSWQLALSVGIAIGLGGFGTGIFTYLTVQRILRPVAALALADGLPEDTVLPGISWRILLSWGLGTAVPVLGIVLVATAVLTGMLPSSAHQIAGTAVFLGVVALVTGLGVMWISTRSLTEPMNELRAGMARVREGDHTAHVRVYDGSEIGLLQTGFNTMVEGLAERERMRDLFGRQVGPAVAEHVLERGTELGGVEREVAVLFCDLVGSTRLAVDRPAHEVVELLNRFFAVIVDVVTAEGGTVNKFLGDAGLCVFGAPLPHSDAAGAALRSSVQIRARMRRELPGYDAGIGVSAGMVVASNVGSAGRFEYTVIGDAVNEAARLTDLAKRERERILASAAALDRAPALAGSWVKAGRERLRGRAEPTAIFKPAPEAGDTDQRLRMPSVRTLPHRPRSDGGGTR